MPFEVIFGPFGCCLGGLGVPGGEVVGFAWEFPAVSGGTLGACLAQNGLAPCDPPVCSL